MSLYGFVSKNILSSLFLLSLLRINNVVSTISEEYNTYIIHINHSHKPSSFETHDLWHKSIVKSLTTFVHGKTAVLYSYSHVMSGFSVRLTSTQLHELESSSAHVGTYPESYGKLLTTHTPKFLGLNHKTGLWPVASYGEGTIIGIIDSGIWPESESFNDKGMPPVPQKWKGKCQNGTIIPFSCNKKLIGAQLFAKGIAAATNRSLDESIDVSPRDSLGHGTHTSSTAAGNYVFGASSFGYAKGTAKGVAPRAHVAMYSVTLEGDSAASDVLAAMDQAIADGVDVMSLSLAFDQTPYFKDVVAIGAFSAMEKGISVVCAAGNDGVPYSISNGAPWIMTVGAGTIDRAFTGKLTLGNGSSVEGLTYFPQNVYISDTRIYYGKDDVNKTWCKFGALNETEVANKVVFCDTNNSTNISNQLREISRVRGVGGIVISDTTSLDATSFSNPILVLSTSPGKLVKEYILNVTNPTAKSMSFQHTNLGTQPAPRVAYFSSRGPDPINPSILKPDIIAPGHDVIAAVPPNIPFVSADIYELVTDYALFSGTSMATPHVAGVVALLKAIHPEWSPAALRSAIMTTSYIVDNTNTRLKDQTTNLPATPLDFGSGHIDPNKAVDPGLVYDISADNYIQFLCGLGYDDQQMRTIVRQGTWRCEHDKTELNYPSFMFVSNKTGSLVEKKFTRIVTNVGNGDSIYKASLVTPIGMVIEVEPSTLEFNRKNEKREFFVSVKIDSEAPDLLYGYLKWVDQYNHEVSSPIMIISN